MFFIILFAFIVLVWLSIPKTTVNETIPKRIILTTQDKSKIPPHIYEQYKKDAKDYALVVFDDNDCEEFLRREYPPQYLQRFQKIKSGAHKADLFRYAYLYKYGGIYLDVKTVLKKDLDMFIQHDKPLFYVVFTDQNRLYNGILCTPPRNEYFLALLNDIVHNVITYYMQICESAARILQKEYLLSSHFQKGFQKTNRHIPNVHMWKEIFCNVEKHCNNKQDRYGYCNFCVDENDKKLFKIRDETYGKDWK